MNQLVSRVKPDHMDLCSLNLLATFMFVLLRQCSLSKSVYIDFHVNNVNLSLSETFGLDQTVVFSNVSSCGTNLNSEQSMGFLLKQNYSGNIIVELQYSCFTLPQPNAYQAVLNLLLAGNGYSLSTQRNGILGQYSVKMHSDIDFTWFTVSNRTYTENGGTAPRMINGKIRFERRGIDLFSYYWYMGAWINLNNMGNVPATLSGPVRVGIFIDLDWTNSYSIGLTSLLVLADQDGDEVIDDAETLLGTDLALADTDGDGLGDADDPRPRDPSVAFEVLVADSPPWNGTAGYKASLKDFNSTKFEFVTVVSSFEES